MYTLREIYAGHVTYRRERVGGPGNVYGINFVFNLSNDAWLFNRFFCILEFCSNTSVVMTNGYGRCWIFVSLYLRKPKKTRIVFDKMSEKAQISSDIQR